MVVGKDTVERERKKKIGAFNMHLEGNLTGLVNAMNLCDRRQG